MCRSSLFQMGYICTTHNVFMPSNVLIILDHMMMVGVREGSLDDQVDAQVTLLLLMRTTSWNVSSYSCQLLQLSLRQPSSPTK